MSSPDAAGTESSGGRPTGTESDRSQPAGTESPGGRPTGREQPAPRAARRPLSPVDAALIAEACTRSDLVWVRPLDEPRARAAWHVWHDDAVCVVHGDGEQSLPDLRGEVEVTARSKDSGAAVVRFVADAELAEPRAAAWQEAATALAKARLNAHEPARQLDRWASGAAVVLLRPAWVVAAGPGDDMSGSESAPVPGGPGTTLGRRPFHLGSRRRRALRRQGRS